MTIIPALVSDELEDKEQLCYQIAHQCLCCGFKKWWYLHLDVVNLNH